MLLTSAPATIARQRVTGHGYREDSQGHDGAEGQGDVPQGQRAAVGIGQGPPVRGEQRRARRDVITRQDRELGGPRRVGHVPQDLVLAAAGDLRCKVGVKASATPTSRLAAHACAAVPAREPAAAS